MSARPTPGPADLGRSEEILQVGDPLQPPAVRMREIVHEADEAPIPLGDEGVRGLRLVRQEPHEGGRVDLLGHAGLVEREVLRPQRAPLALVGGAQAADYGRGQGVSGTRAR